MANEFTVTGKVTHILELRSGDSKKRPGEKWYKQDYVIETFEDFPKKINFNLWGEDRIKQANLQIGDVINLTFTLDSREFNGRWYTDVRAQMITKDPNAAGYAAPGYGAPAPAPGAYPYQGNPFPGQAPAAPNNGGYGYGNAEGGGKQDDLPF